MTNAIHSLTSIAANQMAIAARFGTAWVDAIDRVVAVQMEAANGIFREGIKGSQELLSRDLTAAAAEAPRPYAAWLSAITANHARLARDASVKLHEAAVQTKAEFDRIAADQMAALSSAAKDTIASLNGEGSRMLAELMNQAYSVIDRREGDSAGGIERQTKKAA